MKQINQAANSAQTDDLAPCPFCGGAPVPDFIVNATYLIKCSSCRTRSWFQASAADAVAAWNRRAVKPFNAAPAAVLSDADYAAIVKRYEDAGDVQNADIIRRQWEVARGGGGAHHKTAETRMNTASHGGADQVHARPVDEATTVYQAQVENGRWIDIDLADIAGYRSCFAAVRTLYTAPPATSAILPAAVAPATCRSTEKPQVVQESPTSADADSRQLVVISGQRVGKQHLLDLQRDAGRYRWLRDKADGMACTAAPMVANLDAAGRVVGLIDGEELDAAVDMAAARRATKTKRVGANR